MNRPAFLKNFLKSERGFPVIFALAAGLYPILFYFSNNFALVNSWEHVGYFVFFFLVVPILVFVLTHHLLKFSFFYKWRKYALPFLNILVFLFLMGICHYGGIQKKISLAFFPVAAIIAYFFYKHAKKIVVFQFLLALIGVVTLLNAVKNKPNYSKAWLEQPDDIAEVIFVKKPNVYFIQPDGYPNFSELKKGNYQQSNPDFENLLLGYNFKNYQNFRSNYASTLASNSSIFMMKHHYYNNGTSQSESLYAREVIISKNTVLDVFKSNGYKTNLITESPYIQLNKPRLGYDESNYKRHEIPYISTGFDNRKKVVPALKKSLEENSPQPEFYFIEFFNPGHIMNSKSRSEGAEREKEKWLESLKVANQTLADLIELIKEKDPEGLIIILSDHGGYVGLDYSEAMYIKTQDRDAIYSIFSSILSIYWPNNEAPVYNDKLKTSVNVFRVLFSYLSEDEKYLEHLQDDGSYILLFEGAPRGSYKYIDDSGDITFKKQLSN
jgi:hypothetical protein